LTDNLRNQPLQVEIIDGRLVISIGVELLTSGILDIPAVDHGEVEITDFDVFAQEIALKLEAEEDDGTTVIHHAFDRAAEMAIEDGCDGIADIDGGEEE
jgi:hypothetical protein